jgi:hypothetical protein
VVVGISSKNLSEREADDEVALFEGFECDQHPGRINPTTGARLPGDDTPDG